MTLTQILQKIRNAFYTKKEIDSMGGGASLSDTISQKANDSDVVHKTGNETVNGTKTFTSTLIVSKSSGEGALYVDNEQSGNIYLFASDTARGLITQNPNTSFNSPIIHVNGSDDKVNLYADYVKSGPNKIDCSVEEQGDNYIRYANGLQICWGTTKLNDVTNGTNNTTTVNFPKSFVSAPNVTATIHNAGNGWAQYTLAVVRSKTSVSLTQWTSTGSITCNTTNNRCEYQAIGRWK